MKNYIQPGRTVTVAAPSGGVVSGQPVLIGSLFGVCATTQAETLDVEIDTEGVFELTKLTTDVVTVGAKLYWDSANSRLTITPGTGSKPLVGVAAAAAGNGATLVRCRLIQTLATGPA